MNEKMISPTGKLVGVSQAVPIVEKAFKLNGRVQRLIGRADSFKDVKPNAISIRTESGANPMFGSPFGTPPVMEGTDADIKDAAETDMDTGSEVLRGDNEKEHNENTIWEVQQ